MSSYRTFAVPELQSVLAEEGKSDSWPDFQQKADSSLC